MNNSCIPEAIQQELLMTDQALKPLQRLLLWIKRNYVYWKNIVSIPFHHPYWKSYAVIPIPASD